MPENPLLPDAQLRALHALLKQAIVLEKGGARTGQRRTQHSANNQPGLHSREALLAGTLLQLAAGDVLVGEPGEGSLAALLAPMHAAANTSVSVLQPASDAPRIALAAALARALQQTGSDRLVLVFLRAGYAEQGWAPTLSQAQEDKLPLVIACADPSGADTFQLLPLTAAQTKSAPLHWTSAHKLAAKAKLPILSVDGEDAVAVYRVMQESVLRARSGGGPAVLWAMLPSRTEALTDRPTQALPRRRLRDYMRVRGISL